MKWKAQSIKEKSNKLDFIKIKDFYFSKESVKDNENPSLWLGEITVMCGLTLGYVLRNVSLGDLVIMWS